MGSEKGCKSAMRVSREELCVLSRLWGHCNPSLRISVSIFPNYSIAFLKIELHAGKALINIK